ncbi:LOW QUALITY PROTEIN: hypothetical protein KUTeg_006775 [Tegillarca granosa]|uniref:Uncharacterized protein n=1 Tax=Tegillarca granosa TaxID=220873 RepID=A0ABQ9FG14_TEGGR|nr:LOW QUALITY PROTEIN: hypothetical protein KUTeg_006775 [Tegillarca granosa]
MVTIGTDGASVMTGKTSGVVRLSPTLVEIHCAAHRCSLATSWAAKSISEISKFSQTTGSIFHYFSNSALLF